MKSTDSLVRNVTNSFWIYTIREDDSLVRYLPYESYTEWPVAALPDIRVETEVFDNVFLVSWEGQSYIYKTIDRFFYDSTCTATFETEINYLWLIHGSPNIAQLTAVVKSQTPLKTNIQEDGPDVVTGMLLEYYPMERWTKR